MGVTLVMFTQSGERRNFKVRAKPAGDSADSGAGKARATIGRNRECDIQIALGVVSRRHCEVTIEDDGKVQLRDLGSSNGCFVNNKRVQQAELRAGDTLTLGPVVFTVVVDGVPEEVKAVRTVLDSKKHGSKKKKKAEPEPDPKKSDETGSIDLDDLGLDLEADNDVGSNPLAELEELSKQKGRAGR